MKNDSLHTKIVVQCGTPLVQGSTHYMAIAKDACVYTLDSKKERVSAVSAKGQQRPFNISLMLPC